MVGQITFNDVCNSWKIWVGCAVLFFRINIEFYIQYFSIRIVKSFKLSQC